MRRRTPPFDRARGPLLWLAGVLAIFAALACVEDSQSGERARRTLQMRTLVAMRTVGAGVEEYARDRSALPRPGDAAAHVDTGLRARPWSRGEPVPVASLRTCLEPTYIKILPTEDGWGSPMLYDSDGRQYVVIAPSAGGTFEPWSWTDGGPGHTWQDDFIWESGQFFKW